MFGGAVQHAYTFTCDEWQRPDNNPGGWAHREEKEAKSSTTGQPVCLPHSTESILRPGDHFLIGF